MPPPQPRTQNANPSASTRTRTTSAHVHRRRVILPSNSSGRILYPHMHPIRRIDNGLTRELTMLNDLLNHRRGHVLHRPRHLRHPQQSTTSSPSTVQPSLPTLSLHPRCSFSPSMSRHLLNLFWRRVIWLIKCAHL